MKKIEEAKKQKEDVEKRILIEQPSHAKVKLIHDQDVERLKQVQTDRAYLEATLARMLRGNDGLKGQIGTQVQSLNTLMEENRVEKEIAVKEMMEMGRKMSACNKV